MGITVTAFNNFAYMFYFTEDEKSETRRNRKKANQMYVEMPTLRPRNNGESKYVSEFRYK